ncbi:Shedu anti-phage system protein SduA domain-containing protein [Sorangium sp. So ce295]|uniref:Shedu anti-phage system protein SduA domain-containing protein n=1 Tax=Sorangium sp. So ce295 TaxID=3133295 RepID=UPI003F5D623B
MKLHDKDYSQLTQEEIAQWEALRKSEIVGKLGKLTVTESRFHDYPKAVRHFLSLFPNNYLDIVELREESRLRAALESFRKLLDTPDVSERKILNFIRDRRAYFIVASLLKAYFRFGHHEAHLFPEFQLGNSYKADYLLVGQNSSGWHFAFVELEAPHGEITLENGDLGAAFRKGLAQVADWNTWLEARYGSLSESFDRCRRADAALPAEFTQLDKTRVHYVVIAGRRTDFNERTYRVQRRKQKESSELLLHYDNLTDAAEEIIGKPTY